MKRKILSKICVILLILSMLSTNVLAAFEKTYFASESDIKVLIEQNRWYRNALMPLVSIIGRDKETQDVMGVQTTWGNSKKQLSEEYLIMNSLIGDEFGDKRDELYQNRHQYSLYNKCNNKYDKKYALPALYTTELKLARKPEGKENTRAIDKNKYVIKGLINLLGYRTLAEYKGGFPEGYLKVADEIGLTNGITFNPDDEITGRVFENLLMNALAIPLCLSQREIDSDQRYYKRLLYARDEYSEICDGNGPSGKYRTLMNMHLNAVIAKGVLTKGSKGYKFKISKTLDFNGKEIKNKIGEAVYVNIGEIPFDKVVDRNSVAVIKLKDNGTADLLGISCDNYSLDIKTKEGKTSGLSTINNVQGTGDTFVFTAVTPAEINEISLLADIYNGNQWHEITYDYLKKHYNLQSRINSNNEKVWTCQFGINDPGYRTFVLKVKKATASVRTFITANVNVEKNKEATYQVKMYAPDGRTATIDNTDVAAWLKVGWYTYPGVTMYAPDGRSAYVSKDKVTAWEKVGWYTYPGVTMYAPDGRCEFVEKSDVAAWEKVGWSRK